MSKKKKTFEPRAFEKSDSRNLSSALYVSMLESEAFMHLSPQAAKLYIYMKLQLYGQKDKPSENETWFVFNRSLYIDKYKLFSNGEYFTKYCHELIQHGFIELVQSGKNTKTNNIYRFSTKWIQWVHGTDYRTPAMIKHDDDLKSKRSRQRKSRTKE